MEDYTLEIDKDGTSRFIGRVNVCAMGQLTTELPSDTVEEANQMILQSHLFDHPIRSCSSLSMGHGSQSSEPAPGRRLLGGFCPKMGEVFKLGLRLEKLLDLKGWIGKAGSCPR
jgi:hypothetical protein